MKKNDLKVHKLFYYLTDYLYRVTFDGEQPVYVYHAAGCVAVTGYTAREYAEDPGLWYKIIYKNDRKKVLQSIRKALNGEDVAPFQYRICHKDGTLRWIRNMIFVKTDQAEKIVSFEGLIHDITELKSAEEAIQQKAQQLIQADKMASLGSMVSGIAHEISNPNNYILLNSQFLIEFWQDILPVLKEYSEKNGEFFVAGLPYSEVEENIQKLLTDILNGSVRIKKIVNSLKTFSRQDKGELNQAVDINKIVESAAVIVSSLIKKATGEFQVDYGKYIPAIRGNMQQLEQVMINLLTNACHAIKNTRQQIMITTRYEEKHRQIRIIVQDEGEGIPPENLDRIMEPFFTTKRNAGGTGLGLPISYQIIKNHGGELSLVSKPELGTAVTILLPVPEETEPLESAY